MVTALVNPYQWRIESVEKLKKKQIAFQINIQVKYYKKVIIITAFVWFFGLKNY